MTDIQIFLCGIVAGVVASIISYHWYKRPRAVKDKEVDISKMEQVSDFNESDYTKEHFDISIHSIQTDNDWTIFVDHNEIKFSKKIVTHWVSRSGEIKKLTSC